MADPVARAIKVLNEALERDPEAITELVNLRVRCNHKLAAHPTIRVGLHAGEHRIGVLGLLNGALSEGPGAAIGAKGTRDAESGGFVRVHAFVDLRLEKTDVLA